MAKKRKYAMIDKTAFWLLVVSGVNWGFLDFLGFDISTTIAESVNVLAINTLVKAAISVSAIWLMFRAEKVLK